MTEPQPAEAGRLAVAAMLAAVDGRQQDLHELLIEASQDTLAVAVGGLALAVGAAFAELRPERRAALREGLARCAPGTVRVPAMTDDDHQRLLVGVMLAAHDLDQARFADLLKGHSGARLRAVIRSLAELVVNGLLAIEERPGAARERLAQQALTMAAER